MSRARFSVTQEIVSCDSPEDASSRDTLEAACTLRDALDVLHSTRTSQVSGVESVECDSSHGRPRWITVYNGMEYRTGEFESRSLHIPNAISDSSAKRIARLAGARAAKP